jgi:rRNA-processing protein FCF1
MKKFAAIDTSSILFGFSNKKDVFEIAARALPQYKQVISLGVLRELHGISLNKGRRGASARAALEAIKYKNVYVEDIDYSVDRWIFLKVRGTPGSVAVTNDTDLCKKLKSNGLRCFKLSRDGELR